MNWLMFSIHLLGVKVMLITQFAWRSTNLSDTPLRITANSFGGYSDTRKSVNEVKCTGERAKGEIIKEGSGGMISSTPSSNLYRTTTATTTTTTTNHPDYSSPSIRSDRSTPRSVSESGDKRVLSSPSFTGMPVSEILSSGPSRSAFLQSLQRSREREERREQERDRDRERERERDNDNQKLNERERRSIESNNEKDTKYFASSNSSYSSSGPSQQQQLQLQQQQALGNIPGTPSISYSPMSHRRRLSSSPIAVTVKPANNSTPPTQSKLASHAFTLSRSSNDENQQVEQPEMSVLQEEEEEYLRQRRRRLHGDSRYHSLDNISGNSYVNSGTGANTGISTTKTINYTNNLTTTNTTEESTNNANVIRADTKNDHYTTFDYGISKSKSYANNASEYDHGKNNNVSSSTAGATFDYISSKNADIKSKLPSSINYYREDRMEIPRNDDNDIITNNMSTTMVKTVGNPLNDGATEEMVERVVNKCLNSLSSTLRDDLQHLHVELIKQSLAQQSLLKDMFETYLPMTGKLMEALEESREENGRLVKKIEELTNRRRI